MKSILILALLLPFSVSFAKDDKAAKRFPAAIDGIKGFNCGGTEPFYSVQIKGDKLTFVSPDTPDKKAYTVKSGNAAGYTGSALSYKTADRKIFLTLINENLSSKCSDGMSEKEWPYHMVFVKGDMTLYGCCEALTK